jgi:hypothetical protein
VIESAYQGNSNYLSEVIISNIRSFLRQIASAVNNRRSAACLGLFSASIAGYMRHKGVLAAGCQLSASTVGLTLFRIEDKSP